jgi:Holliday junction resolvasome RuvABC endonuclease subunit
MMETPHTASRPSHILALDLGTITGWALSVGHCPITSGTVSFKPSRYEGGGLRYLRFHGWLHQIRDLSRGIDRVYFEEVRRHSSTDAAHVYGGFLSHLSSWCENHTIPYQGVPVGTIKKHVTGKGNANKEAVINAVKALGYHPNDDNEADALSLLAWAKAQPNQS